jgi:hypothetical protein
MFIVMCVVWGIECVVFFLHCLTLCVTECRSFVRQTVGRRYHHTTGYRCTHTGINGDEDRRREYELVWL